MNNKDFTVRSYIEDMTGLFGSDSTSVSGLCIGISDKESNTRVCNISGYVIYSEDYLLNAYNVFNILDNIGADCCIIGEAVCDADSEEFNTDFMSYNEYLEEYMEMDTIFILDRIEVNPDFRGQGIGSFALSKIDSVLNRRHIYPGAIYGLASPYEHMFKDDYNDKRELLANFYRDNGYSVHMVNDHYIICRFPEC